MEWIFLPLILGWVVAIPATSFAIYLQERRRRAGLLALSVILVVPWLFLMLVLLQNNHWVWRQFRDMLIMGIFDPDRFLAKDASLASAMFWLTNGTYAVYLFRLVQGWPKGTSSRLGNTARRFARSQSDFFTRSSATETRRAAVGKAT